ncbi:MAG: sigma-70 family RNA polymerase sigma factor [Chloroflexi bacterium]|nr:sigma-70 family RNA polymerase sigma factor [Chloroflexota bacterium]
MNEDADLVSRTLAGDLDAFEALYNKYKRSLYRTALAITEDDGAADEILQDCFLRAYAHLPRLDLSTPLAAWLHRIAINLSYNRVAQRRLWSVSLDQIIDRLGAGSIPSPEQALERSELRERVRRAIHALGFEQRVVVLLYYLQGFSLAEIAYILDCPLGTVKSRLHHARRKLRRELGADVAWTPGAALDLG